MSAPPFLGSKVLIDAGVPHGFFTRAGGHSTGAFHSNNMSVAIGDEPRTVDANRRAAAEALGHPRAELVLLKQVHSTTVVVVDQPNYADQPIEADAMVTARPNVLLGILTADCSPVLLADPEAGVVGAAHAGWKGAVGGIVNNTIDAMVGLGAERSRIRAAIGPTISARNYEVGPELAAEAAALDPLAGKHIAIPDGKTREHLDIPHLLAEQLFAAGIGLVADLGLCTYANPTTFFSHRYATHHNARTGRQISIIGLPSSSPVA